MACGISIRGYRLIVVWIQIILFILQTVALGFGLTALIWGWIIESSTYDDDTPWHWNDMLLPTPSTILIVYGGLLTMATIPGFLGSINGYGWMIRHGTLLGIFILLLDLLVGISVYTNPDSLTLYMEKLAMSMNDYNIEGAKTVGFFELIVNDYWDRLQEKGKCCGYNSYKDWLPTRMGTNDNLPSSCCKDQGSFCGERILWNSWSEDDGDQTTSNIYLNLINEKGCLNKQKDIVNHFKEIGIIGPIIGILLIISLFLALLLSWGIQGTKYKRLYTFRELIKLGMITRVGTFYDLSTYKNLAKQFQIQKREEYFDRTGGKPKNSFDGHPADAAEQVKKWVVNVSYEENHPDTPPSKSTHVWPYNLKDEHIEQQLVLHVPISTYLDTLEDTKKIRRE